MATIVIKLPHIEKLDTKTIFERGKRKYQMQARCYDKDSGIQGTLCKLAINKKSRCPYFPCLYLKEIKEAVIPKEN